MLCAQVVGEGECEVEGPAVVGGRRGSESGEVAVGRRIG